MKIASKTIRLVLTCAIALLVNTPENSAQDKKNTVAKKIPVFLNTNIPAQEAQIESIKKISDFLNENRELRDYSKNGYTSSFSGEFRVIPEQLRLELLAAIPEFKFYIAKMKVLIDPPSKNYDLILFADSGTTDVEGFIWGNYWTIRPSNSFKNLLQGRRAASKGEAVSIIKAFAKLLAFASNQEVGKTKIGEGKVQVEMIKGKGVFSILEIKIDKNLKFNQVIITEPDGKALRHFV